MLLESTVWPPSSFSENILLAAGDCCSKSVAKGWVRIHCLAVTFTTGDTAMSRNSKVDLFAD